MIAFHTVLSSRVGKSGGDSMSGSLAGLRFALSFVFFATALMGQRDLATLAGTITDPSNLVVAGAKVTLTNTATGESYELTSNAQGEFVRPALLAATYTITVTAPGFKKAEQRNV